MTLNYLLKLLNYDKSENYHEISASASPSVSHLARSAARANVKGAYFFQASPKSQEILPARVVAYVAEAQTPEQAREIHRKVWNLGNAPFLIVVLPNQFRIYTGFDYDQVDEKSGLLDIFPMYLNLIGEVDFATERKLNVFSADSIDSGSIWENTAQKINLARRVDRRLLTDLAQLEKEIVARLDLGLKESLQIAHALIGKYIYIKYLRDREILSNEWLEEEGISLLDAVGRDATYHGLCRLSDAIEARFRGDIFPFPKNNTDLIKDEIVSLVAGVFEGDRMSGQRHLNFEAYDFSFIPVETLSEIYEQFLHSEGTGKLDGAIYTPEPLADYLICEIDSVKALQTGMKVLDPCCGSGIFLVLTYQRMIEQELSAKGTISPQRVRQILLDSIYGVERNEAACRVTGLSLILTMLNYIDPPQLHKNKDFKFPKLHNIRIFNSDFFNDKTPFWLSGTKFDFVIGNPPWIQPSSRIDKEKENFVLQWIADHRETYPVEKNRVAEAFSWRVADLVKEDGCIGLILHAKSLFNHLSKKYRKAFFTRYEVFRITNFSNLAYILFDGRGQAPAYTAVYKTNKPDGEKSNIIHFAPLVANQVSSRAWINHRKHRKSWTITINEDEIKVIDCADAAQGDALLWKLAMWGNYRDQRTIKRLRNLFSTSLSELIKERRWDFHGGLRLRNSLEDAGDKTIIPAPYLKGWKVIEPQRMNESACRFHVPQEALRDILEEECNTDVQAGTVGLKVAQAPHLILNISYFAFSNQNFIIPKPHIGLSVPSVDEDYLRALSVYLNSSFSQYLMFWENAGWGIERSQIGSTKDIETLPLPLLSDNQIKTLAQLHRKMARSDRNSSYSHEKNQESVDDGIQRMFKIPDYIRIIVEDFLQIRLGLNKGKTSERAVKPPEEKDLLNYGKYLKRELDNFAYDGKLKHKVSLIYSLALIVCEIELVPDSIEDSNQVSVARSNRRNEKILTETSAKLKQRLSQWVYVQRGMRIFEPSKVYICKMPRLVDWTMTQAMLDARDIIAEVSTEKPYLNSGGTNAVLTA